jgi:uncharacterized membrane protein SirB2
MENRRLELNTWNRILHHLLTIGLFAMGLLMFYLSTIQPTNPTPAALSTKSIMMVGVVWVVLSIICFFWLESKLIFHRIETRFDHATAIGIILETARKNKWHVNENVSFEAKRLKLTKFNNWRATTNEITIELTENFVFVNARGNYPTDRKIVKKLRTVLQSANEEPATDFSPA